MRRLLATCFLFAAVASAASFYGPTPYLSFNDSPFNGLSPLSYFYLENYEAGIDGTPGVTRIGGTIEGADPLRDSVDADDGSVDGDGTRGHAVYLPVHTIRFQFDAVALGSLPSHAGIVWTDVGADTNGIGTGPVQLLAYGPGNVLLGTSGFFLLGDGMVNGGTSEDRFFGVSDPGGIFAIEMNMPGSLDWEVDHLQYGAVSAVPEPGTSFLCMAGAIATVMLRRKRKVGC